MLLGTTAGAAFHGKDFAAFLGQRREKYGLVFLDPPYRTGLLEAALAKAAEFDILNPHGIIVAEHPADAVPGEKVQHPPALNLKLEGAEHGLLHFSRGGPGLPYPIRVLLYTILPQSTSPKTKASSP